MNRSSLFLWFLSLCAPVALSAEIHVHYDTGWGNSISIRGDGPGLNWNSGQGATWTSGNDWVYTTPNTGGAFEFKPLFNDNIWSKGANYTVPSADAVVHVYPFFGNGRGSLVVTSISSSYLGNTRGIRIFLPPSYSENTLKHYPVLYMHDGQNLFSASTSAFGVEWQVDETSVAMVYAGEMEEVVIVGIDNTSARMGEYTPTVDATYGGGNGDAYLNFIQYELMPAIDNSYRTKTGAGNTVLMGSSLGGLISYYAGWTRPGVFGKVGCMSSSFWWDNEYMINVVAAHSGSLPGAVFYIDTGSAESGAPQTENMRVTMENKGFQHGVDLWHWYAWSAGHNEASWAARLDKPLARLLPWR
ncbi:MAG: alpha/beta hydrolase-fold protein [Acidobacteriota bacterium]|nr:alpha/beta hydrolase-fold protein [Acidobacteriota bacterium]